MLFLKCKFFTNVFVYVLLITLGKLYTLGFFTVSCYLQWALTPCLAYRLLNVAYSVQYTVYRPYSTSSSQGLLHNLITVIP